jgi:ribosomal protein S17
MMSVKEKDLDSSPEGDHVRVPSVRTPSTSKAMAWRVVRMVESNSIVPVYSQ